MQWEYYEFLVKTREEIKHIENKKQTGITTNNQPKTSDAKASTANV